MMTFLEELSNCRLKPERKAQLCQAAEREYAGTCILVCVCVCVCVYTYIHPERKAQLCQAAEREYAGTCIYIP